MEKMQGLKSMLIIVNAAIFIENNEDLQNELLDINDKINDTSKVKDFLNKLQEIDNQLSLNFKDESKIKQNHMIAESQITKTCLPETSHIILNDVLHSMNLVSMIKSKYNKTDGI